MERKFKYGETSFSPRVPFRPASMLGQFDPSASRSHLLASCFLGPDSLYNYRLKYFCPYHAYTRELFLPIFLEASGPFVSPYLC